MSCLAKETGGTSYKAFKYGLDHADRPTVDYDENGIIWKAYGETRHLTSYLSLKDRAFELQKNKEFILTFFLDGSRRVYKVDDIAYNLGGNRTGIYPAIAGQIGVACTHRVDKRMQLFNLDQEIVIALPDMADKDGRNGYFKALAMKINKLPVLSNAHVEIADVLKYKTDKDTEKYSDKGVACIQEYMIEKEKNMVASLVRKNKLNQDNYLVKDGSLEYRPSSTEKQNPKELMKFKQNYNWVIGVSKSFNPDICKDINGHSNPKFIADLPYLHRTPVSKYINPKWFGDTEFAVWYIRIRPKEYTRTAFDGIVKVEKILVKEKEINHGMDSDDVDTISASIINERIPVCYGSDLRWANHLYPIYLTESLLKAKYLSADAFLHLF